MLSLISHSYIKVPSIVEAVSYATDRPVGYACASLVPNAEWNKTSTHLATFTNLPTVHTVLSDRFSYRPDIPITLGFVCSSLSLLEVCSIKTIYFGTYAKR